MSVMSSRGGEEDSMTSGQEGSRAGTPSGAFSSGNKPRLAEATAPTTTTASDSAINSNSQQQQLGHSPDDELAFDRALERDDELAHRFDNSNHVGGGGGSGASTPRQQQLQHPLASVGAGTGTAGSNNSSPNRANGNGMDQERSSRAAVLPTTSTNNDVQPQPSPPRGNGNHALDHLHQQHQHHFAQPYGLPPQQYNSAYYGHNGWQKGERPLSSQGNLPRSAAAYTYASYRYHSGQSQEDPAAMPSPGSASNAHFAPFGHHLGAQYLDDPNGRGGWAPPPPPPAAGSYHNNGRHEESPSAGTPRRDHGSGPSPSGHWLPDGSHQHPAAAAAAAPPPTGAAGLDPSWQQSQSSTSSRLSESDGRYIQAQSPSWHQTDAYFDRVAAVNGQPVSLNGPTPTNVNSVPQALPHRIPADDMRRSTATRPAPSTSGGAPYPSQAERQGSLQQPRKRAPRGQARDRNADKRFICPHQDCNRAFARNYNLQAHLKSHFGIRDFKCPECDKSFSRKHDCTRHCVAVHNYSKEGGKARVEEANPNVSTKYVTAGFRRPEGEADANGASASTSAGGQMALQDGDRMFDDEDEDDGDDEQQ